MATETNFHDWLIARDPGMDSCQELSRGVRGPEVMARGLGRFLHARLAGQPATPETSAVLSVVRFSVLVACYPSNGETAVRQALSTLLALALAWRDHPDYLPSWRPEETADVDLATHK